MSDTIIDFNRALGMHLAEEWQRQQDARPAGTVVSVTVPNTSLSITREGHSVALVTTNFDGSGMGVAELARINGSWKVDRPVAYSPVDLDAEMTRAIERAADAAWPTAIFNRPPCV